MSRHTKKSNIILQVGDVARKRKRVSFGQVMQLASKLGVETEAVEHAIAPRSGVSKTAAFSRLNGVTRDLERSFQGDNDALQRWMQQPNEALDGETPVELLEEGRIEVLERVRDAIKSLSFG